LNVFLTVYASDGAEIKLLRLEIASYYD